jgi:prepilin-type N-terminal cleavage/methylation domain-containing protein
MRRWRLRQKPRQRAGSGRRDERGITLIEIMVVVGILAIIAAIALIVLYQDVARKSRLAADNGTVAALRSAVAIYYGKNDGTFPPSKPVVHTLVMPAPTFQCPGQDYTYDPSNGMIALLINNPSGC